VGFLYTEKMELNIDSDPFWSPYETVKLFANLEIKRITLGQGNPQFKENLIKNKVDKWEQYWEASVEFNFIDANSFLQFVFGSGKLGCFDII
jgi:hypothetical protein